LFDFWVAEDPPLRFGQLSYHFLNFVQGGEGELVGISSSLLPTVKLANPEGYCSGPVGPANFLALDSSSRDNLRDAETITGICVAVHKFVHLSWQKYFGVSSVVSPNMTFSSHRKPASARTCNDSCCAQGHNKMDILHYND